MRQTTQTDVSNCWHHKIWHRWQRPPTRQLVATIATVSCGVASHRGLGNYHTCFVSL